jgi:hypothetical protein
MPAAQNKTHTEFTLDDVVPADLREVMPAEYQQAMLAYAQEKGRQWKARLREDFATGRDVYFRDQGHLLRQIRNHPTWAFAVYRQQTWMKDIDASPSSSKPRG